METMIQTLATAAQTSAAATWKVELKRILVTAALSLAFLGVSSL